MSPLATDPLRPLLELPGVAEAVETARFAIAEVHRHPTNRRGWPTTAAEASVRAARASAVLDGGSAEIPAAGEVSDPVLAGALRVAESVGLLLTTWQRAPLQALARMHVLAAADLVPGADPELLGRPTADPAVAARLDLLAQLVAGGSKVPGPVVAAVVHGELLTLVPFAQANGVIARAAARLTCIATGLDLKGLGVPEVSWMRHPDAYLSAARGFASGEPDGVANWIVHYCASLEAGAKEAVSIAEAAAAN